MDVFNRETREAMKPFLDRRPNFPDCIAPLNAVLAGLTPGLTGEQIAPFCALIPETTTL
jgi:hypothetical protein